jgi:hypothetical protein
LQAGSKDLVAKILQYNNGLKAKEMKEWPAKVQGKPLQKAEATGLFLGCVLPARVGWVTALLAEEHPSF